MSNRIYDTTNRWRPLARQAGLDERAEVQHEGHLIEGAIDLHRRCEGNRDGLRTHRACHQ